MKVTVTQYLQVRVGEPSLSAPSHQKLAPGSELEVENEVYNGEEVEGESRWLRDAADNYYWVGGTDYDPNDAGLESIDPSVINYNKIIEGIPDEVRATKGEGTLVCVMDTGCYKHNAFGNRIVETYDATNGRLNSYNDSHLEGHGTAVCGIIGAQMIQRAEMVGVAPKVKLMVIKIASQSSISIDNFRKGLEWIINRNVLPNVLNLSFAIPIDHDDENVQIINNYLSELSQKGVIIIAAAQDEHFLFDRVFYPSSHPDVISVGALSTSTWETSNKNLSNEVNFIVPNKNFHSVHKNRSRYKNNLYGCSFSTAVVTGVTALIYARVGAMDKRTILIQLMNYFHPISNFLNQELKIYYHESSST